MSNKILVTGATGNIGREVVKILKEENVNFIAASTGGSIEGVNSIAVDFADAGSVKKAMEGVSTVFMLLASHPDMITWGETIIDAAKKSGVKHIVRSGGSLSDATSDIGICQALAQTDQYLKDSGIDYTITAPNFFMQNFINFYMDDIKNGALYLPAGDGKMSWVDVRDIAAVNVAVLLDPKKYRNQTLTITGPEALSYTDTTSVFSRVLGKDVNYVSISYEDAIKAMTEMQFPEFVITLMIDLFKCVKAGNADHTTSTVKGITGREPISFGQFVQDNKAVWI